MTRLGPDHVAQNVDGQLVITDGIGGEVVIPPEEAARLAAALPYLLTGSTAIADVAAERLRQMRHHSRSVDLNLGPDHAANMLQVASLYLSVAAKQVRTTESMEESRDLVELILTGRLEQPEGWPEGWVWDPAVEPARNAVMAAALSCAALDVLAVVRAAWEAQRRG